MSACRQKGEKVFCTLAQFSYVWEQFFFAHSIMGHSVIGTVISTCIWEYTLKLLNSGLIFSWQTCLDTPDLKDWSFFWYLWILDNLRNARPEFRNTNKKPYLEDCLLEPTWYVSIFTFWIKVCSKCYNFVARSQSFVTKFWSDFFVDPH